MSVLAAAFTVSARDRRRRLRGSAMLGQSAEQQAVCGVFIVSAARQACCWRRHGRAWRAVASACGLAGANARLLLCTCFNPGGRRTSGRPSTKALRGCTRICIQACGRYSPATGTCPIIAAWRSNGFVGSVAAWDVDRARSHRPRVGVRARAEPREPSRGYIAPGGLKCAGMAPARTSNDGGRLDFGA